jgi:hypothetical protein
MAANTSPIYSASGMVQGGEILTTAASDFTGQGINNLVIFSADLTNGGFIQRLRFKAIGTNAATGARIYINNGQSRAAASISAVSGTPTGTISATGGTLQTGTGINYLARIVAVDQYGGITAASTETASVSSVTTGSTGSITWNWTAVIGAVSYRIYVGPVTNGQLSYFTSSTNSYTQTTAIGTRDSLGTGVANNNYYYGDLTLPAVTVVTTTASGTVEIDYPLNFALPPGYRIIVGLTSTVAGGWQVSGIGGNY